MTSGIDDSDDSDDSDDDHARDDNDDDPVVLVCREADMGLVTYQPHNYNDDHRVEWTYTKQCTFIIDHSWISLVWQY